MAGRAPSHVPPLEQCRSSHCNQATISPGPACEPSWHCLASTMWSSRVTVRARFVRGLEHQVGAVTVGSNAACAACMAGLLGPAMLANSLCSTGLAQSLYRPQLKAVHSKELHSAQSMVLFPKLPCQLATHLVWHLEGNKFGRVAP